MESKSTTEETQEKLYQKISNSWNIILDFLDINTIFQYETVSKYFRNNLLSYYEFKQNLLSNSPIEISTPLNQLNDQEKKEQIIKFKKQFLSKYLNLLVNIDISKLKFYNDENNKLDIIKKPYVQLESQLFKNKIQIQQILIKENYVFILYHDNKFIMLKFDFNDNAKKFRNIFSYDFAGNITKFKYYENQNEKVIFFVKKNSVEFFYLNLNELEYNMKQINLKQDYEIFNEENIFLKEVFILDEFFLFFTNKDEFILFPDDLLKIFKSKLVEEEKEKNDTESDSEKNSNNDEENTNKNEIHENSPIPYPQKLEKNYGEIKFINSNNINVVFINNEYQIYSIPMLDCKNYKKVLPKFKLFCEQKFPNFYTLDFSKNSFLLLEKTRLKPLEEWNTQEIYKWFEDMELDDYLNIIKYQKITGKDIVQGGKDYLLDVMGLEEDHINKLNYEMGTLKFETSKDMKLWGWGNNKNGQLGITANNQTFLKLPTHIDLPNLMPDDTIEKIFCYKDYSILLTKFGNIFATGKYSLKDQSHISKKNSEKNNSNQNTNKKNKGKNKHKEENKNKKSEKNKDKEKNNEKDNNTLNNTNNNWINISQSICYTSYNLDKSSKKNSNTEPYFKIKEVFGQNDNISFIGFYSNKIPFFAYQRKPKFKHLKKGGKFITSDKVIEHIKEFLSDKIDKFKVVYGDSLLKMLETNLEDYLESEIPIHKIIQIKDNNEIIWDRKKRYFKENFINENLNKI